MRNAKTLAIVVALGLGLIFLNPFAAQAKKKHERQKGGLPALEDRVDALTIRVAALETADIEQETDIVALETAVAALQGQNQFACVNADGTIGNHSTGVTSVLLPTLTGGYEVDFGTKDIHACAAVATIGTNSTTQPTTTIPAGFISVAGDPGAALDADGEVDSDAIFVQTKDTTGAAANLAFCLYVSCP